MRDPVLFCRMYTVKASKQILTTVDHHHPSLCIHLLRPQAKTVLQKTLIIVLKVMFGFEQMSSLLSLGLLFRLIEISFLHDSLK